MSVPADAPLDLSAGAHSASRDDGREDAELEEKRSELRKRRKDLGGDKANVVLSPDALRKTTLRRDEWIRGEAEARERERLLSEEESKDRSDRALKFVLLVWLVIIAGILAFVFNSIRLGWVKAAAKPPAL